MIKNRSFRVSEHLHHDEGAEQIEMDCHQSRYRLVHVAQSGNHYLVLCAQAQAITMDLCRILLQSWHVVSLDRTVGRGSMEK
jgi:hypothetical protein